MSISFRNFLTRLFHWEYWPFGIIQLPLIFMWLWYSLRERSFFYFTASNPGIYAGGMMGESKFEVLSAVPDELKPKTILIKIPSSAEVIQKKMNEVGLNYPIICKPDLGERGWMVTRVDNPQGIEKYLQEIKIDFVVQELIDLPLEFGVFYVRFPHEENGVVSSITGKEFLWVEGNGKKTFKELILENKRACLQWKILKEKFETRLDEVIPSGEKITLVSIGNHCLGTKFLNNNYLITDNLSRSFDRISKRINGFYFGRYDLRCASIDDLQKGNVKIVELNGCGAEPSHIYHPQASLWSGLSDLIVHWQNMYHISKANHARGVAYVSFREGMEVYRKFKALKAR
ncbi:MAG: hypothetical protein JST48_03470 [Bacteroidetes bacterium]|nr:hypothetical protein [Bacteroidota bacterium]